MILETFGKLSHGMRRETRRGWDVISSLFDALIPPDCCLCGTPAWNGGIPVCDGCAGELPRHDMPACPCCALPTPEGQICGRCLCDPPAFDSTRALYGYVFPADVLVCSFKYRHRLSLARFFVGAAGSLPQADAVVPMPLHSRRLSERGFNQALEIARPLARAAGLPLEQGGVVRERYTPPQAMLDREARLANPRGVFACRRRFDGLRVMVVDDVMTTGASLDALARCLKAAGAEAVHNFVLARAGW
ncbi:MAG: ComF family protein [Betaproteobacteria bacterium]|nr:ComF family protein [Betaproteobacteria bacterium]